MGWRKGSIKLRKTFLFEEMDVSRFHPIVETFYFSSFSQKKNPIQVFFSIFFSAGPNYFLYAKISDIFLFLLLGTSFCNVSNN